MQLDGPARDAGPCHASLAPHRRLAEREWVARHVVLPAMKALLRPRPCRANDGSLLLLTSMERLYRVFERCG
jgi:DNA mismatch repair protein MLH1